MVGHLKKPCCVHFPMKIPSTDRSAVNIRSSTVVKVSAKNVKKKMNEFKKSNNIDIVMLPITYWSTRWFTPVIDLIYFDTPSAVSVFHGPPLKLSNAKSHELSKTGHSTPLLFFLSGLICFMVYGTRETTPFETFQLGETASLCNCTSHSCKVMSTVFIW